MNCQAKKVINRIKSEGRFISERQADEINRACENPNNNNLDNIYARQGVVRFTPAENAAAAEFYNKK